MMLRINLLPHREIRREQRKKTFISHVLLALLAGLLVAVIVALVIEGRIATQQSRNDFIQRENRQLDEQIREIAQLRQEIESLRARQQAVESLQRDRTVPVHLMDDLARHTPEGMHFRQLRQEERRIRIVGLSESNERVSNLLREFAVSSPWLERPELVEIKAVNLGRADKTGVIRRAFEFSVNASVRAPQADDASPVATTPASPRAGVTGTR